MRLGFGQVTQTFHLVIHFVYVHMLTKAVFIF